MPNVNTFQKDESVSCKYYRKESSIAIKCLGMCGTHTCHFFKDKASKTEYKTEFCRGFYWNCPCYIQLEIDNGEAE